MGELFMDTRYNVYFAGEVLDGQDPAAVRSHLGQLFKADAATLDKLFSGKTQLVKRHCDKATALKYKQAMEQAGAAPVIKIAEPAPAPATNEAPAAKLTAAQRIAMLANAPDAGRPDVGRPDAGRPDVGRPDVGRPEAAGGATPVPQAPAQTGAMDVLPPGSEVLRPEERPGPVAATVMAPDLEVAAGGERLSATPPASPPAPDTSHLSTAAVGETLPTLPSTAVPLSPDTSALSLSPEGTDFSDCVAADVTPRDIDLSGIDLAPAGADVLEKQYRKRQDQPAPNTDHLSLDD